MCLAAGLRPGPLGKIWPGPLAVIRERGGRVEEGKSWE